jgi:hypothetical protein
MYWLPAGCFVFILQWLLILSISPEKHWVDAWLSMASHWDSKWYQAIAQYGYLNIDGPAQVGMTHANVVFFPGYPYLARLLVLGLHCDVRVALLCVSQSATLLFWCVFFYILRELSIRKQAYAAFLVLIFPTSWFMDMAYSESLFIVSACLVLLWASEKRWLWSSRMAILMTATRIVGISILAAPFCAACVARYAEFKTAIKTSDKVWIMQEIIIPNRYMAVGALGCLGFFLYCAIEFDSWSLYFDMERLHWASTANPWFLFKLETWVPPPWGYAWDMAPVLPNGWANWMCFDFFRIAAYTFSELLVPLFLWSGLFYAYWLLKYSRPLDERCLTWFFAGALLFLVTCMSIETRHYEAMSRYVLPVWIFWIISDALNLKSSLLFRRYRSMEQYVGIGFCMMISLGFWIQLLNRFYIGWWVA